MERKELKTGMKVLARGREAIINKIEYKKVKVGIIGESARWVPIDEIEKIED